MSGRGGGIWIGRLAGQTTDHTAEEGETPAVSSQASQQTNPMDAFGPNEWLVDEIYQQYLRDPHSVDKAWWEFFADYRPAEPGAGQSSSSAASDQDGATASAADAGSKERARGLASAPGRIRTCDTRFRR